MRQRLNCASQTFFSDKTVQLQLEAMNDLRGLDADRKLFDALVWSESQYYLHEVTN
jgi:hypothetical protein